MLYFTSVDSEFCGLICLIFVVEWFEPILSGLGQIESYLVPALLSEKCQKETQTSHCDCIRTKSNIRAHLNENDKGNTELSNLPFWMQS